jgi:hypothetical protein
MSKLKDLLSSGNLKDRFKKSIDSVTDKPSFKSNEDSRIFTLGLTDDNKGQDLVVRFLPSLSYLKGDSDLLLVKNYKHYYRVGTKFVNVKCLSNIGQACPICDSVWSDWSISDDSEKEQLKSKMAKRKYLVNAYIVSWSKNKEMEDKVVLMEIPLTIYNILETAFKENDKNIWDVTEEGYDVYINIKVKQFNDRAVPNYDGTIVAPKPSELAKSDKKIEKILEQTYDLQEILDSGDYLSEQEMINYLESLTGASLKSAIQNKLKENDFDIDLDDLDEDELIEYMKEHGYKIGNWKKMSEEELREAIFLIEGGDKKSKKEKDDEDIEDDIDDDKDIEDDIDDDDDDKEVKKPKPKSKSKKEKDDDIDDDDDTDDIDDIDDIDDDDKEVKKSKSKKEKDDDDDDDLDSMDRDELIAFMKRKDLTVKNWKKLDEDELRDAIEDAIDELDD